MARSRAHTHNSMHRRYGLTFVFPNFGVYWKLFILENLNKDDTASSFESFLTNTTSVIDQSLNQGGSKNYRNQTVVYASDCQHTLVNAIKSLQVNESPSRVIKLNSNPNDYYNNHTSQYDAQMCSLYESIKDLIEQALFQNSNFLVLK